MNIEVFHPKTSALKCQVKYLSIITTLINESRQQQVEKCLTWHSSLLVNSGTNWALQSHFPEKEPRSQDHPQWQLPVLPATLMRLPYETPSLLGLPCFFFFPQALHCHSYSFQMLSPLWYWRDKIIRLGSTVEAGKVGNNIRTSL